MGMLHKFYSAAPPVKGKATVKWLPVILRGATEVEATFHVYPGTGTIGVVDYADVNFQITSLKCNWPIKDNLRRS